MPSFVVPSFIWAVRIAIDEERVGSRTFQPRSFHQLQTFLRLKRGHFITNSSIHLLLTCHNFPAILPLSVYRFSLRFVPDEGLHGQTLYYCNLLCYVKCSTSLLTDLYRTHLLLVLPCTTNLVISVWLFFFQVEASWIAWEVSLKSLRPSYFLRTTLCGCPCEVSNPPSVEDTWVMWRELLATYFWASGKAQFQHLKFFKVEALIQILSFRYWLTECVLEILCMLCSQQGVRWDRESPFECHYVRQEHLYPLFLTVV